MRSRIIITLVFWLSVFTAAAQAPWKLAEDRDGIKVYTRPMANSKLNALKVDCVLNCRASQLVALIMDIDNSSHWVYHAKLAKVIKQVSPAELYYYSEVIVPWPVQNRDYIAHIMVTQNPTTKVVTIDAPCIADMLPSKANIVRIKRSTGRWVITPLANNRIHVEYVLEVDPGGAVPAWLINLFATKGPLETFEKLKLELQKTSSQNLRLAYIADM